MDKSKIAEDELYIRKAIRFKLEQVREGLRNRIKNNRVLSFRFAMEEDGPTGIRESRKRRQYAEAYEELQEMFDKEARMALPFSKKDLLHMKKTKIIGEIMSRINMFTNIRRGNERLWLKLQGSIAEVIEAELAEAIADLCPEKENTVRMSKKI
jgi:hypothetical protein